MTVHDFQVTQNDGREIPLSQYRGKPLLIVNVASQCGFTPQYTDLEKLYEEFHPQGLEILAFPCNQFGAQEPGSDAEIRSFCTTRFHVTFPLFKKIDVNGPAAAPLYQFLKKQKRGILGTEAIKWNFTKFLVDKKGQVRERFAPTVKPLSLRTSIQKLLSER